jgi:hypothetical protein
MGQRRGFQRSGGGGGDGGGGGGGGGGLNMQMKSVSAANLIGNYKQRSKSKVGVH